MISFDDFIQQTNVIDIAISKVKELRDELQKTAQSVKDLAKQKLEEIDALTGNTDKGASGISRIAAETEQLTKRYKQLQDEVKKANQRIKELEGAKPMASLSDALKESFNNTSRLSNSLQGLQARLRVFSAMQQQLTQEQLEYAKVPEGMPGAGKTITEEIAYLKDTIAKWKQAAKEKADYFSATNNAPPTFSNDGSLKSLEAERNARIDYMKSLGSALQGTDIWNGQAKAVADLTERIKDLKSEINGVAKENVKPTIEEGSIDSARENVKRLRAEIAALSGDARKAEMEAAIPTGGNPGRGKLAELADAKAQLDEYARAQQEANRVAELTARINSTAVGSYNRLAAEVSLATIQIKAMSDADRESASGQELIKQTKEKADKLNEISMSFGNYSRNVGNYSNSIKDALKGVQAQFNQVARELPAASISADMFFLAISNNLPYLSDAIQKLKEAAMAQELNKAKTESSTASTKAQAAATAESAVVSDLATASTIKLGNATLTWAMKMNVAKAIGQGLLKSLLSWNTILMIGITLLTMYGGKILDFIKNWGNVKGAVNVAAMAYKQFQQQTAKGMQAFQNTVSQTAASSIVKYQELSLQYQKLGGNMKAQTKFIKDHQAAFQQLGLSISKVSQANATLIRDKDKMIKYFMTLAYAAAYEAQAVSALQQSISLQNAPYKTRNKRTLPEMRRLGITPTREQLSRYDINTNTVTSKFGERMDANRYEFDLTPQQMWQDIQRNNAQHKANAINADRLRKLSERFIRLASAKYGEAYSSNPSTGYIDDDGKYRKYKQEKAPQGPVVDWYKKFLEELQNLQEQANKSEQGLLDSSVDILSDGYYKQAQEIKKGMEEKIKALEDDNQKTAETVQKGLYDLYRHSTPQGTEKSFYKIYGNYADQIKKIKDLLNSSTAPSEKDFLSAVQGNKDLAKQLQRIWKSHYGTILNLKYKQNRDLKSADDERRRDALDAQAELSRMIADNTPYSKDDTNRAQREINAEMDELARQLASPENTKYATPEKILEAWNKSKKDRIIRDNYGNETPEMFGEKDDMAGYYQDMYDGSKLMMERIVELHKGTAKKIAGIWSKSDEEVANLKFDLPYQDVYKYSSNQQNAAEAQKTYYVQNQRLLRGEQARQLIEERDRMRKENESYLEDYSKSQSEFLRNRMEAQQRIEESARFKSYTQAIVNNPQYAEIQTNISNAHSNLVDVQDKIAANREIIANKDGGYNDKDIKQAKKDLDGLKEKLKEVKKAYDEAKQAEKEFTANAPMNPYLGNNGTGTATVDESGTTVLKTIDVSSKGKGVSPYTLESDKEIVSRTLPTVSLPNSQQSIDDLNKRILNTGVDPNMDLEAQRRAVKAARRNILDQYAPIDTSGGAIGTIWSGLRRATVSRDDKSGTIIDPLGINDKDGNDITGGVMGGLDNLSQQMMGFVQQQLQYIEQIKQAAVDAANAELEAARNNLQTQEELRANGYANEVASAQRNVQEKARLQKKALKEQQKAQQAQMKMDTAMQVSSLITASANIFKAFSGIPVVGIALAIAAIGAMFAAFTAAQSKAREAIKSQNASQEASADAQAYGKGGYEVLKGGSHASGNDIDLHTKNGEGKNMRAEGGEGMAIFSRKSTKKYGKALPQIVRSLNEGDFEKKYGRKPKKSERIEKRYGKGGYEPVKYQILPSGNIHIPLPQPVNNPTSGRYINNRDTEFGNISGFDKTTGTNLYPFAPKDGNVTNNYYNEVNNSYYGKMKEMARIRTMDIAPKVFGTPAGTKQAINKIEAAKAQPVNLKRIETTLSEIKRQNEIRHFERGDSSITVKGNVTRITRHTTGK